MRPERALRWLDSLDAAAYAVRQACAGYWGRRLLIVLLVVCLLLGTALIYLPGR